MLGVVIGGLYAWWQLQTLARHEKTVRERGETPKMRTMLPGSFVRVAVLLVVLVLVQVLVPGANLLWLAIGVAVAYAVPFGWRLKQMIVGKK
jgi:fatty acid desaturase